MKIRDRIKELRRVRASDLKANPANWKRHPDRQRKALQGLLQEVGYADALLARELDDGSLELIDGHLRADVTPRQKVPVLVLDVTEQEAHKLLASLDPLAAMSEQDDQALAELLEDVETEDQQLGAMLEELLGEGRGARAEGQEVELRQLATKPPPKMTWVLVGLPTVRFGEIAEVIQGLAGVEGIVLESTSNDG